MADLRQGAKVTETRAWNDALLERDCPHLLQTQEWGLLKKRFGWRTHHYVSSCGQALLLLRRTPLGQLAYVPRGPALSKGLLREEALANLAGELHHLCQEERVIALKLEPNWQDEAGTADLLSNLGFRPAFQSVQPRSTVKLDISRTEEQILAGMKPKTRYNIRLAERKGVTVREGTKKDIPAFMAIMNETSQRDGFAVHTEDYYQQAYGIFAAEKMAALLLAEYDSELLAGLMVFAFGGESYYLYGASSSRHRNLMPTYALQWAAIRWAQRCGCHTYDLWGIPDEVGQDPEAYESVEVPARTELWGVWRFKKGFGGQVSRCVGAWDYVYHPLAYKAYQLYYSVRRQRTDG